MSSSSSCSDFKAHSINPNRCRRCFKDISEHQTSAEKTDNSNGTEKTVVLARTRRTPSITGDNSASKGSLSESLSTDVSKSTSTARSISSKTDASQSDEMSSSPPTASFTVKSKRVKFVESESNNKKSNTNDRDSPVDVAFTVCVKKTRGSQPETTKNNNEDYQSRIKELSQELTKSKEKIDNLEAKNKELENMRKSYAKVDGKESIKQNFDENIKLKQKIDDLERTVKSLKSDKKLLEDKAKLNEKQQPTSQNKSEVLELQKKLEQSERLVSQLTQENEDIKKDVKSLEVEFQELHDNFREDQSGEFRVLKRELESTSKNCRVMQFKLKKSERTVEQLENEKIDLQKQVNDLYATSQMDVDKKKMKDLENELAIAKEVSLKLHAEIEGLKSERINIMEQLQEFQRQQEKLGKSNKLDSHSRFGKLSPSPSIDQTNKDYEQVVRDLYDTMEREKDIQEQLKFAEEETKTIRKKLSTMEQENEILMMQIRKMASKNNSTKDDEDDDGEELNPEEMKLHLELYEQEMIVLRRKTDELEQENENFQQEIKYLQEKLISQPLTKVEIPEIPAGSPPNVIYDHKIRILEAEARELRKKLVDKEKENESLRTEVELHRKRASKVIMRSRSLDGEGQSLDTKKQLQLFEQEANILRQKLITLENDNEKLANENKRLQIRVSKKPPPGPADQLQLENMELKDKIRDLDRKCNSLKTDLMNSKLNESTETETDFIGNLKKQLRLKENDLTNLTAKLSQLDIEFTRINRDYKKLKDSLNPRRRATRVIRETATRMELKEIIKEMDDEINDLQTNIRGKDVVIENQTEETSELKREKHEVEQKFGNNLGAKSNGNGTVLNSELEEIKKKFQAEQHRAKSLEAKLERLGKDKSIDLNSMDTIEILQAEKKELAIQLDDMSLDLQKARSQLQDLEAKFNVVNTNKEDMATVNAKLRKNLEKLEDQLDELNNKLRLSENGTTELQKKCDEAKHELERVMNLNKQLKTQVDEHQSKLTAINSRSGGVSEKSALLEKDCKDLKRKLDDANSNIDTLQSRIETQKHDFKEKEDRMRGEFGEKLEQTSKKVRREVHLELQSLREECTTYKNRCSEMAIKLEKTEKEVKEANDKIKSNTTQMRKERDELTDKLNNLEHQLKSEQRRREKLEKELDNASRCKEEELLQAQGKIVQMERESRRLQAKLEDAEYDFNGRVNTIERELTKTKQEYEDLTNRYEQLEKDFVGLKSRSVTEKDTLVEAVSSLKKSYEDKLSEIKSLKESSISHQKEWYKEKLAYQERVANLEKRLNRAKMIEEERNRLKVLMNDNENLLNSYRKEEKNRNEERERTRLKMEEYQNKIAELEKVERNSRFQNMSGRAQVDKELQNYRIRLEHSETSHKGELAALHAEYEGRMRLLGEEVEHFQQQIAMVAQERDRYRELYEKNAKEMTGRGGLKGTLRDEVEDLNSQLRTLRSDLEGALLENRNLKIQHGTERSTWQIQQAESRTQINQLEERILLETRGATRNYARTKMELAWDKERQESQRLLQETQKFIQELRDKLIGTESLREKERDEARKQLMDLKLSMDREHVETQQKIAELQFDLLALKEVHSRLKSQNDRLRRERAIHEKAKIDFVNEEIAQLQQLVESAQQNAPKSTVSGSNEKADMAEEIIRIQQRLKTRLEELMNEASARGVSNSEISILSRLNGKLAGSSTSISSTNLPLPSAIKRAPPRTKLIKKSLSLDQQLSNSNLRGASQERIWDSDHSLTSTPNSSVSNLRLAPRFGYAGYESDSSGSSFFVPSSLRLRPGFTKEDSFGGGSESDTSAASSMQPTHKKTLKERFKIHRSSKTSEASDDEASKMIKQKLSLQGFELSPLELAKQREKKEKSLRYKISKTLSKTFSRSASVLPGTPEAAVEDELPKSKRNKSPSRTKSPVRLSQDDKQKQTDTGKVPKSSFPKSIAQPPPPVTTIPGLAQLKQKPVQSNLAIPPSTRPPPKIRLRNETNV